MSRVILAFHTLVFSALIIVCLASPIVAARYPDLFHVYSLWVFGFTGISILGSWYVYSGQCPFTVWENTLRKKEGKEPYAEPCMDRYAKEWFNLTLPSRFSDIFPIAILFIPVLTRFFV